MIPSHGSNRAFQSTVSCIRGAATVMVTPQCLPAALCSLGLEASKLYFPGSPATLVLAGIWWETRKEGESSIQVLIGVWGISPATVIMEMGRLWTSAARQESDCLFPLDLTVRISPTAPSRSWLQASHLGVEGVLPSSLCFFSSSNMAVVTSSIPPLLSEAPKGFLSAFPTGCDCHSPEQKTGNNWSPSTL